MLDVDVGISANLEYEKDYDEDRRIRMGVLGVYQENAVGEAGCFPSAMFDTRDLKGVPLQRDLAYQPVKMDQVTHKRRRTIESDVPEMIEIIWLSLHLHWKANSR